MRPRFQVALSIDADEARRRLTDPLRAPDCPVEGVLAGYHMEFKIPKEERHFWSPNLSVELEDGDEESRLSGLFGPRPSVWTLFATYYAALAFIAVMGGMFGFSQWFVDESPWALWSLPVSAAGFLLGYSASLFGQRLATDQMEALREYLRGCLESFVKAAPEAG